MKGDAKEIYDGTYCGRGDMENRIKEQQLGLFADRTSCHDWWPNQLRLLLSTLGYVLVDGLRQFLGVRRQLAVAVGELASLASRPITRGRGAAAVDERLRRGATLVHIKCS